VAEFFESYIKEEVGDAFFILPTGEIITVTKHIETIFEHPEVFGFTKDQLLSIYDKHNESPGQEGNAREEIIRDSIERGIVRVRRYASRGNEYWSINVYKLNNSTLRHIETLAKNIADKTISRYGSQWDTVRILETKTNKVFELTVNDIINFKLYDQVMKESKYAFSHVTTIEEVVSIRKLKHMSIDGIEKKDYLIESALYSEVKEKVKKYCEINDYILTSDEIEKMQLKDYDDFFFVDKKEYNQYCKKYGQPKNENKIDIDGTKVKLGTFNDGLMNEWVAWCILENDSSLI
jgi:hypothetical protein